jgi:hypothetical protein
VRARRGAGSGWHGFNIALLKVLQGIAQEESKAAQ